MNAVLGVCKGSLATRQRAEKGGENMNRRWGKLADLRRMYDDTKAHEILESCGLKYHHSAKVCRYVSKRSGYGICELYSGHYGTGVAVYRADNSSINATHGIVEYWLEEGD